MRKLMIAILALLLQSASASAQEPDFNVIARIIVTKAAEVEPGEVVLIRGSTDSLEIFESLVAETIIAGGLPIPVIEFSEASRRGMQEAPIEYLRQEHAGDLALVEVVDVYIHVTPGLTPQRSWAGIPLERRNATQEGRSSYFDAVGASSHREVYVGQSSGVPTIGFAEFIGADFEEMEGVFWRAVSVTPEEHENVGARVADSMAPGAEVHLTSPEGTDLTFVLSNEPGRINTGRVSEIVSENGPVEAVLPAGEFSACVDPTSANGVVVAPVFTFRLREEVVGLTLRFKDGIVTDVSYESGGESLREFLLSVEKPSLALSLVSIGLNPESRILQGSTYRSWEMSGMVTVFLGDNTLYDCGHVANFRLHPHIEGLTLTADGKQVVKGGDVL
ncbi:MAG: aminopeptidase [Pseudohongiella sp.]|nr:aminopeptidase [Pseudohongiella sp.]